MTDRADTVDATVERASPRRVVIRFRPGTQIGVSGLADIFEQRKRLQGADPVSLLVVLPQDAQLDIAVRGDDQFARNEGADGLIAMATVAGGGINEVLTNLFFAYFPQGFPNRVFGSEPEAAEWLDGMEAGRGV